MGLTPLPKSDETINFLFWKMSSKSFWWFYAILWHYVAPITTILYFSGEKISLIRSFERRKRIFYLSFSHPLFWFLFTISRPALLGMGKFPKNSEFSENIPNYPYFFLERVGFSSFNEIAYTIIIFVTFFWIFWFSSVFFWWYSKRNVTKTSK
jgi:hypothetical protein